MCRQESCNNVSPLAGLQARRPCILAAADGADEVPRGDLHSVAFEVYAFGLCVMSAAHGASGALEWIRPWLTSLSKH